MTIDLDAMRKKYEDAFYTAPFVTSGKSLGIILDALQGIPALLAEVERRWIPVSERLPDIEAGCTGSALVLVCRYGAEAGPCIINTAYLCGEDWYDENGYYQFLGITHWMPLPAPPKEAAHEQK